MVSIINYTLGTGLMWIKHAAFPFILMTGDALLLVYYGTS